ncbi:pilin [Psychrobacter sp. ASPA161_6]|uniref:pilin n=1 Tax=Psychrobacter sp. ASPA161_6 TaxID=3160962 RepID=UPI003F821903
MKSMTTHYNRMQSGFTLIELMIVIVIIGILVAISIPIYQNYIKKAAYTEVIVGMTAAKTAIDNCYAVKKTLTKCDTVGKIDESLPSGVTEKVLNTVTITENTAVITAIPNTYRGIKGVGTTVPETCKLSPLVGAAGSLIWNYSGVCVDKGYVR